MSVPDSVDVDLPELDRLACSLEGVRRRSSGGLLQWRLGGRLVARQLDDSHVVIRAPFDTRDVPLTQFPDTFTVPSRFQQHMMVVANLAAGSADAIEDAVVSAWRFQRDARSESRRSTGNG